MNRSGGEPIWIPYSARVRGVAWTSDVNAADVEDRTDKRQNGPP